MKYANGKPVPACKSGTRRELRMPGREREEGNLLNAELLLDDAVFVDLYDMWIAPAAEAMSGSRPEPAAVSLFFAGASEEAGAAFLERFRRFILGREPYGDGTNGIWPLCPAEKICRQVDQLLADSPQYLRLRVKVFSMLLGVMPEEAFAEGTGWSGYFCARGSQADRLECRPGMAFPLTFSDVQELYPAVLTNDSDRLCQIEVTSPSETFRITLPPRGFLRAVFADPEHTRLVSVKGNISFNSAEARNAVVQLPRRESQALYLYHMSYRDPFELETGGPFTDAAADGRGGAVILGPRGLYCTHSSRLLEDRNPVRVYGAGNQWAWHYANGHLEGNLRFRDGRPVTEAIAVAEQGDQSLLFLDEAGAWRCRGGIASPISEKEFVQGMLGRFLTEEACEISESSLMRLRITHRGTLEA